MSSKTIVFFSVMALLLSGAEAATITVGSTGADHATIQGAIDAASPGDVVEVEAGTYSENLVVKTTITLRAAGDGTRRPIVDGGGRGSALTILADGVEVEGLILENGGFGWSGIEVRSKDNLIRKNLVTDNRWYGIYLDGSTGTAIEENVVWNNKYGIWINTGSDENRIERNVLEANDNYNAFDLGKNIWDGNFFGDYDGSAPTYAVPGISSVDPSPSGPEREDEAEDEAEGPLQEEEVDAEAEEEAGDLASGSDDLLSGEEPLEDIVAEGPAPQDPGSWSGQSLADLGLSLGSAHPEETEVDETEVDETEVDETEVDEVEEFARAPAFGDAIVDFEEGEAAPEGPGGDEGDEGDGESIEDIQGSEEISVDAYAAEDWLRRGDALADEGRYAEALASYDRALEMEPDFAEAWDGKGDALMMTGSYDKAVRSYERALSIDPTSAESWYHKGNALQMLLRFEEALGCYEEAVRIEPSFAEAWNRKGVILNRLGLYHEALESFDRALAIEPGYAAAWNSKSWAHQMLGEADPAKEAYERARSLGYR